MSSFMILNMNRQDNVPVIVCTQLFKYYIVVVVIVLSSRCKAVSLLSWSLFSYVNLRTLVPSLKKWKRESMRIYVDVIYQNSSRFKNPRIFQKPQNFLFFRTSPQREDFLIWLHLSHKMDELGITTILSFVFVQNTLIQFRNQEFLKPPKSGSD